MVPHLSHFANIDQSIVKTGETSVPSVPKFVHNPPDFLRVAKGRQENKNE